MGNLTINNGGIITNSTNLPNIDLRYGPYNSIKSAYEILGNQITPGLVIGVREGGGEIVEYQVNRENTIVPRSVSISYNNLDDLPKINNTELTGNKTSSQLGLQEELVSGTNIKTINDTSILGSGNISIPKGDPGQDAVNPFKGWFDDTTTLNTAYPTPALGDYAYIKGATASDPAAIYECTTAGTWTDSGRSVDTSNVQTFETGQAVNETAIDNTVLVNPASNALAKATDVMQLSAKLEGVTASETKVTVVTSGIGQNVFDGQVYTKGSNPPTTTTSTSYKYIVIDVEGYKSVRFRGRLGNTSSIDSGWAFYDETNYDEEATTGADNGFLKNNTGYISYQTYDFDTILSDANGTKEYVVKVPNGAKYLKTCFQMGGVTSDNFYCYLQSGESVGEKIANKVEVNKIPYTDYSKYCIWDSTKVIRGANATLQSSTYGNAGYTDFIPVDNVKGLVCSNPFSKGSGSTTFNGGYVYDSSKQRKRYIGSDTNKYLSKWYVKTDGDAYVRFNLGEGAVISELTDDNIITPSDISNYEALKISEGAVVANQKIFVKETGKNLCNPDKITIQTGLYIGYQSGNVGYSSATTSTKGVTDFIPMNGKPVICNHAAGAGIFGYACYDENYHYIRGGKASSVNWRNGDYYVRFTLNSTTEIQVEYGTVSTEYEPYMERVIFNDNLIPREIEDINTYEQGVDIVLPSTIYCTKGDTLYLYWRSFIEAVNPKAFDCCSPNSTSTSNVLSYPDCLKIIRTADASFDVVVRDNALNEVAKKTVNFKAVNVPTSPASAINVLLVGASREANGVTPLEVYRRLVGDSTMSPAGLGLTNINFIGRKGCKAYDCNQLGYPSSLYSQVKHEAVSGKKIHDMVVAGDLTGYTFYFEPNLDYVFNQGDKYTDGTRVYTVVGSDPAAGDLQVSISSGSGTPSATGTLTLTDGSGTTSVNYTSYENETSNPFWNSSTGKIDFAKYSTDYCNGATINILVLCRVMNDLWNGRTPSQIVADYTTVIDAFHEYNPSGYVVINLAVLPSMYGGLPHSYTNGKPLSTAWYAARINLEIQKLLIELGESYDYKDFCLLSNSNAEFDLDYFYSKEATTIRNRGTSKTINYDNNGLHFSATGKQVVADSIYHCVCKIINDINGQS